MVELRSGLVLLVAVVFGLSLVFPVPDLPETCYDESETLPCEYTHAFSLTPNFSPSANVTGQASLPENPSAPDFPPLSAGSAFSTDTDHSLTVLNCAFRC